jgi:ketosteroid isomerase-like protein
MRRAVNAGDAAAYARVYAPDAVITIHGGDVLAGRPAIEAYEVALLRQFPGTRFALYDVWQAGPRAVVRYGVNTPRSGGGLTGHEGLLFYEFLPSGLIGRERRYQDSLTPMAQLGLLGPGPARRPPTLPAEMAAHIAGGSPAESANVSLATACLAALVARDEGAFLSRLSADAVLDDVMETEPRVGRRAIQDWFESWTSAVPTAQTEVVSVFGVGDTVLVETIVRGTLAGTLGRVTASGREFTVHRAAIVRTMDGKVDRLTFFTNGKELAQAVGAWPPGATGSPSPSPPAAPASPSR